MREILALDGLRGIAALLVVGFHVVILAAGLPADGMREGHRTNPLSEYALNWGFIGVDFFFVLSAFLLSQPFLAKGLDVKWGGYAAKRLLRVIPAYYASVLLVWLLIGRTGHPWFAIDWHQLWTHLTFMHWLYPDTQLSVSPVYWTLYVEMQFYLILPFVAQAFRGRAWPVALATAFAATMAYRWWIFDPADLGRTAYLEGQLPAYLWHFALGITIARFRRDLRGRVHPTHLDLTIVLAALAFVALPTAAMHGHPTTFSFETRPMVVGYRPIVAIGFAAIILLACSGVGRVAKALESRPMRALGRWSYSLYLTHYPLGAFILLIAWPALLDASLLAITLVLTVASIAFSGLYYRIAERPALDLKARYSDWLDSRRGKREPDAPDLEPAPPQVAQR